MGEKFVASGVVASGDYRCSIGRTIANEAVFPLLLPTPSPATSAPPGPSCGRPAASCLPPRSAMPTSPPFATRQTTTGRTVSRSGQARPATE